MKTELFNDNFQNYKRYGIPKAQLVEYIVHIGRCNIFFNLLAIDVL